MQDLLPLINGTTLLLFGIILSFSFSGVEINRKNASVIAFIYAFCAILQALFYAYINEETVWKIYPLITHLPIILTLILIYKKSIFTSSVSVLTTYMMCQPSKLAASTVSYMTENEIIIQFSYTLTLVITAVISLKILSRHFKELFGNTQKGFSVFATVPIVFYVFDYIVMVFPNIWKNHLIVATEFLPFFICIVFLIFCLVYQGENEKRNLAEKREQIIRISAEQQAKEFETIKEKENEIKILRHDLRLFLGSLSMCINEGDYKKAQDMIASYTSLTKANTTKRFCPFTTINYVLSNFDSKFRAQDITFIHRIEIEELRVDEILLSSIISNALDNALNAQKELAKEKRLVQIVMKDSDGKLLISVKNPYDKEPVFKNGIPITTNEGHGIGVQSIRYITERLNGNYQFSSHNGMFTVRIII